MLCDICHKNPASIHIQEITNGQKKTLNLCSDCAAKHSEKMNLELGPINLAGLLYNKAASETEKNSANETTPITEHSSDNNLSCPECQWTFEQLRKSGKVGCRHCYEIFGSAIRGALPNMHRGLHHVGKTPQGHCADRTQAEQEITRLQQELNQAVGREEFEQAAQLRDQILKLKEQLKKWEQHEL